MGYGTCQTFATNARWKFTGNVSRPRLADNASATATSATRRTSPPQEDTRNPRLAEGRLPSMIDEHEVKFPVSVHKDTDCQKGRFAPRELRMIKITRDLV